MSISSIFSFLFENIVGFVRAKTDAFKPTGSPMNQPEASLKQTQSPFSLCSSCENLIIIAHYYVKPAPRLIESMPHACAPAMSS